MPISETHNIDCMEFMAGLPDGFFDLVIADPPYGIGEDGRAEAGRLRPTKKWVNPKAVGYKNNEWDNDSPNECFFLELKRVSKNQIVWGANHFISKMPHDSSCWIIWDKKTSGDFADGELAWTSFKTAVRIFEWLWSGFKQASFEKRQHPTQKPVALYKWLLTNYAKPGHKIFDPMMGSQSSRIAAWDMGFDYYGCELDSDYYRDGEARFAAHIAKPVLFAPEQMYNFEQATLF
jgi:site-specific DNA-methyltransferase (adenine-specific)